MEVEFVATNFRDQPSSNLGSQRIPSVMGMVWPVPLSPLHNTSVRVLGVSTSTTCHRFGMSSSTVCQSFGYEFVHDDIDMTLHMTLHIYVPRLRALLRGSST